MFRRRTNKLVWIIGIPVIAYGLAKGGMYLKAKQMLDDFILDNSNRVSIQYGDIETELSGVVRINNVSVVPLGETEPISIIQVVVRGPDAFTYILSHNPVTGDEGPPAHLKVLFRGVSMGLTGELARSLEESYQSSTALKGAASPDPCSPNGHNSLGTLAALGMNKLYLDGEFGYRYDELTRAMDVTAGFDMEDVKSVRLDVSLNNITPAKMQQGALALPGLDSLTVTMNVPPAFGNKLTEYCAEQTGMTSVAYTDQVADEFIQGLADDGLVLGRGLRSVVRDFYRNWGEVEIKADPATDISLMSLILAPPENIEEKLGLQLTLNDRFVTDLGFELGKDTSLLGRKKETKPKKAPPRKPSFKREYRDVPVSNLGAYVDRAVRVHVQGQPVRNGTLSDVKGRLIAVEQRVQGGKFTAHVSLDDIKKVEVEFLVRVNPPSAPEQTEEQQAAAGDTQSATEQ